MNAPCNPPALAGSYLVLETTNKCSLACVHCSISEEGHAHHQRVGFIDPLLVKRLFDDLVAARAYFDTLIMFWLGEPLIHPKFAEIYRMAVKANSEHRIFGKIELHTNATHLDDAAMDVALNNSDVEQVWHFSIDAAKRATYREIKGRDRFFEVERNLARLVERKGSGGAKNPRLVFQYIVSSANFEEAPSFMRRWRRVCERAGVPVSASAQHVPEGEDAVVFFKQLDCPTPELQNQENRVFRQTMKRLKLEVDQESSVQSTVVAENLNPCSGFWKSPVVSWDGDLTVCTRDNLHSNAIGNLADSSFSELWWGSEMRNRRKRVASGNYSGLDLCSTCFIPKSSNYIGISQSEIALHDAWAAV
jgi:radical SAM protein with 4Fe4S-binding SPASM domain